MSSQQLIDYIKQAQTAGQSKEQIRSALLGAGWQGKDVDDALSGAVFPAQSVTPGASHPSKLIIIAVSLAAVLFIAGGGFAYWYFAYEPKQEVIQEFTGLRAPLMLTIAIFMETLQIIAEL